MSRLLARTMFRLGRFTKRMGRWQGGLQVAAAVLAFGLGLWGFMRQAPPVDAQGWLNNLFKTLQLITLHFPNDFSGDLPWQLQIGRLAVPAVALLASLNLVVSSLTRPARLALLSRNRDHAVFFGVPKLTDEALAWLVGQGYPLMIVCPGVQAARLQVMEGLGLTVVDTDPLNSTLLDNLNLKAARGVFVATGDDVANANLSAMVLKRIESGGARRDPLILAVEFQREDLASELVRAVDGLAREHKVRFYRLSPDREALDLELERAAPLLQPADGCLLPNHALVVGLAGDWEQVLSRLTVALQTAPDAAPILTLCLNAAELERFELWRAARPDLPLVADVRVLARPPSGLVGAWCSPLSNDGTPAPRLVLVLQSDADGLVSALALGTPGSALRAHDAVILVRQSRDDHILPSLGSLHIDTHPFAAVRPFGGVLREVSVARLFDRAGEHRAITLHGSYLDAAQTLGAGSPRVLAAWESLPENVRDANRSAVRHAPLLLRAIGRDPARFTPADLAAIRPEEWECLARIEHRRWCADRVDHGWRFAPTRNDAARQHPCLVPWAELTEPDRQKDRNAVAVLLGALAREAGAGLPARLERFRVSRN